MPSTPRSDGAGTTNYHLSGKSDLNDYDTGAAGNLTGAYLRGADGLISQTDYTGQSPVTSYDLFNPHGDTSATTDANGNITGTYRYDSFGNVIGLNNLADAYTGKWQRETDDSTGLIRMGAREYDPALGRFISADPLTGDPTVPQQLSRYPYVGNDPLSRYDLSGLDWRDWLEEHIALGAYDYFTGNWHVDVNETVGAGPGVTFGFEASRNGLCPYCGLAGTTFPGSISIMVGPGQPSSGFNTTIAKGGYGIGGQVAVDSNFNRSLEGGVTTPGSLTSYYYVWGPYPYP